jgi:hypothetical protein
MLLKRLFLGALLLWTIFVMITGCASTGESKDNYATQYRNASSECIRFGYRRDSYDYHRCIERRVGPEKEVSSPE